MALTFDPLIRTHVLASVRKVAALAISLTIIGSIVSFIGSRERPFEGPGILITALVAFAFGSLVLLKALGVWLDARRLREMFGNPRRVYWVYPVQLTDKYGSPRGHCIRIWDAAGSSAELVTNDVAMAMAVCTVALPHALFGHSAHNQQMYELATGSRLVGV
ncbi:MAG: hypothetical protein HOO96_14305 [Polyangiaceae bacterium]|nr:hypothetical protein [Polyangiaceae bacterium]